MVIFGALNTRPAEDFLAQIKPIAAHIHCLTIADQPAAIAAEKLANIATSLDIPARPASSAREALTDIDARTDKAMPVIICGSLYLAGQILAENKTLPD